MRSKNALIATHVYVTQRRLHKVNAKQKIHLALNVNDQGKVNECETNNRIIP